MKGVLGLVVLISLVFACSQSESKKPDNGRAAPQRKMAEVSELAALMKQIHIDAKDWRQQLLGGEVVSDSLSIYNLLVNSTPTDSTVTGPVYRGMAANYQSKLNDFLTAKEIDLAKSSYNNLVTACVSCHHEYCPGPVPTIKKLYLK
ncbi:MAG: hypothetical protein MK086_01095 [Flavobacteriales bacterium]|nr:hypothetical protein [Flavobacteriales bacterium]